MDLRVVLPGIRWTLFEINPWSSESIISEQNLFSCKSPLLFKLFMEDENGPVQLNDEIENISDGASEKSAYSSMIYFSLHM